MSTRFEVCEHCPLNRASLRNSLLVRAIVCATLAEQHYDKQVMVDLNVARGQVGSRAMLQARGCAASVQSGRCDEYIPGYPIGSENTATLLKKY